MREWQYTYETLGGNAAHAHCSEGSRGKGGMPFLCPPLRTPPLDPTCKQTFTRAGNRAQPEENKFKPSYCHNCRCDVMPILCYVSRHRGGGGGHLGGRERQCTYETLGGNVAHVHCSEGSRGKGECLSCAPPSPPPPRPFHPLIRHVNKLLPNNKLK